MYNIKARREELGYTLEEVGKMVGVGKSTVRKWEQGMISNMGRDKISKLSQALKISPLKLIIDNYEYGEELDILPIYSSLTPPRQEKVYRFAEEQLEEQNQKQTVVTLGKTAAGDPLYQEDIIEEEKEVSAVPAGADVALVVQGDSMEPDFESGSVVFYKKQPQVENGELAVVHIKDDGITFKKVLFDYDDEKIILRSLNDKYEDKVFDADNVNVLGKVIT